MQVWLVLLLASACLHSCAGCEGEQIIGSPDADADVDTPRDTRDPWPDTPPPDLPPPDTGPDTTCSSPPVCMTALPDHSVIGGPCLRDEDCGPGHQCCEEATGIPYPYPYSGCPGGMCASIGIESCDPDDPSTCPPGTRCFHMSRIGPEDHYACLDACSATDISWNPYDWSCGCREGYACSLSQEVCLPGCMSDRQCCELWDDWDGDFVRDPSEVLLDEDCTNWCDGDDPDEYPGDDCKALFDCINEGDPEATWHSECLFDSDCPADARCLNEIHYVDEDTGRPDYPGGICIKDRCELPGRGCEGPGVSDLGGECVNIGTSSDPDYVCIATCHTGFGPEDGDLNPCRHPIGGDPYTCTPHPPEAWFPAGTNDGTCKPAVVPVCDGPQPMYSTCPPGETCLPSPMGLGMCFVALGSSGFASAWCNQYLAENHRICGMAPAMGAVPRGVCALGKCLASCDTPHGELDANGCPEANMACYPNDGTHGPSYHDPDGVPPAGWCLSACRDSADCAALWSGATVCNTTTGVCGV